MTDTKKEWFEEWFESPYYDLLYSSRNDEEAGFFLDNLLSCLQLKGSEKILDLACGKGRHSVYLNKKGFHVTGLDLSERSISYARQFENKDLQFQKGDMRVPLSLKFDVILNLFTSFGYFEEYEDNVQVLKAATAMLVPDGVFVLDYLNSELIYRQPHVQDQKVFTGAEFLISKEIRDGFVIKSINLKAEGRVFNFQEKVRLFNYQDFIKLFDETGFEVIRTFGSYKLEEYEPERSERLIIIAGLKK